MKLRNRLEVKEYSSVKEVIEAFINTIKQGELKEELLNRLEKMLLEAYFELDPLIRKQLRFLLWNYYRDLPIENFTTEDDFLIFKNTLETKIKVAFGLN